MFVLVMSRTLALSVLLATCTYYYFDVAPKQGQMAVCVHVGEDLMHVVLITPYVSRLNSSSWIYRQPVIIAG